MAKARKFLPVLLLSASLFLTGCLDAVASNVNGNDGSSNGPELVRPIAARIDTARVDRGSVENVSAHWGVVRVTSVPVNFGTTTGNFGTFHVRLGESVTEGQVLASFNTVNLERQIESQEDTIERLHRSHALENELRALDIDVLAIEYDRMVRTSAANFDQDVMDAAIRRRLEMERLQQLDEQARERQALTLRNAEIRLTELVAQLEQSQLRAPFDGVVSNLSQRSPNSSVPAFYNLVYLAPSQETHIEYVGSPNHITLPAFDRIHAVQITGNVEGEIFALEQIPITVDDRILYTALGRTPPDRFVAVNPPEGGLRLGAGVQIKIYQDLVEDALRIPMNSLFSSPDMGTYVYRIENGMNIQVLVRVGLRTPTFIEILGGLEEGDEIFVRP